MPAVNRPVVCVGDSITAGQDVPRGAAWPHWLPRRPLLVRGVNGDTTRLGLERFPRDVQEAHPDMVIIQFGHNDGNRWASDLGMPRVSLSAYRANLIEMTERSQAFGARKVLILGIHRTFRDEAYEGDMGAYNAWAKSACSATACNTTPAEFVPIRDLFPAGRDLILPDGLHLSPAGHREYARIVSRFL